MIKRKAKKQNWIAMENTQTQYVFVHVQKQVVMEGFAAAVDKMAIFQVVLDAIKDQFPAMATSFVLGNGSRLKAIDIFVRLGEISKASKSWESFGDASEGVQLQQETESVSKCGTNPQFGTAQNHLLAITTNTRDVVLHRL